MMGVDLMVLLAVCFFGLCLTAGATVWAVAWVARKQGESLCRVVAQTEERVKLERLQTQKFANQLMASLKVHEYVAYRQAAGNLAEYSLEPVPDHAESVVGKNGEAVPQNPVSALRAHQSLQERVRRMEEAAGDAPYTSGEEWQ